MQKISQVGQEIRGQQEKLEEAVEANKSDSFIATLKEAKDWLVEKKRGLQHRLGALEDQLAGLAGAVPAAAL